jgi:predicted lipoprotein with Yx(FWY)xxD motif
MVSVTGKRTATSGLVGLLAAALVIAGCGSSSSKSSSAAPASSSKAARSGSVAIGTTTGSVGTYLTGASGRPLYMWVADTGGASSCSGQCAKFWPPVLATASPTVSGAAKATDLGTITRADGNKQVTYKGHPLYYFLKDASAGSLHGQGSSNFGAKWWLVAPTGAVITKTTASASSPASSSSSSGGSHYGY